MVRIDQSLPFFLYFLFCTKGIQTSDILVLQHGGVVHDNTRVLYATTWGCCI